MKIKLKLKLLPFELNKTETETMCYNKTISAIIIDNSENA